MVCPVHSVMSKSSPFAPWGNAQSNLCTRFVNKRSLVAIANVIPGHPLLPAPNGINWKSRPLKSIVEFKNLSGWNQGSQYCTVPASMVDIYHTVPAGTASIYRTGKQTGMVNPLVSYRKKYRPYRPCTDRTGQFRAIPTNTEKKFFSFIIIIFYVL